MSGVPRAWGRLRLVWGTSSLASADARRSDMVAALAESCGDYAMHSMRRSAHRQESRVLQHRPIVRKECVQLDVSKLSTLPENTFGHAYARFMLHYMLDANSRATSKFCEGPEYAYVTQRYRETHDFVHVACGLPPSVVGEIGLKWFELVQTGLPMCALSAFGGACFSRLTVSQMSRLLLRYAPWAVRSARQAAFLPGVNWERWMEVDMEIMRSKLCIDAAPAGYYL